jgi:hypothetical protein
VSIVRAAKLTMPGAAKLTIAGAAKLTIERRSSEPA